MRKIVKVTYDADTLHTEITVNGKPSDTSRISGVSQNLTSQQIRKG